MIVFFLNDFCLLLDVHC